MFKLIIALCMMVALTAAKPGIVGVSAPLIAAPAPVVTATSSQYFHRITNGLAAYVAAPAAYVAPAAPYVAAPVPYASAPYVAAPYVSAPYVSAPYVAAASAPLVAY